MDEEFIMPYKEKFTIYSKSGCKNCLEVKRLLKNEKINFIIINCDEYLIENREVFLKKMKNLINTEYKIFPFVFHDGVFIGDFNKTIEYCYTLKAFENFIDF